MLRVDSGNEGILKTIVSSLTLAFLSKIIYPKLDAFTLDLFQKMLQKNLFLSYIITRKS